MLSLDSPTNAQLSASAVGVSVLMELDFVQGTQYLCSWNDTLVIGGRSYNPLGANVTISNLGESEDNAVDRISLRLPITNTAMLALAIGLVENYRGRQGRIYLQLLSGNYVPVGSKILRYAGYMEPVRVSREQPSNDQGSSDTPGLSGNIELPLSRAGLVRSRNYDGLRITHQQQKARYPNDNSFEYVKALQDLPAQWLSVAFQKQT